MAAPSDARRPEGDHRCFCPGDSVQSEAAEAEMSVSMDTSEARACWGRMAGLWTEQHFTDLCFRIDGEDIRAHRCVVASASPVLQAMLTGRMHEAIDRVIEMREGRAGDFRVLLTYIYGGDAILHSSNLIGVLELAAMYQIDGLVLKCASVLTDSIDATTCTSILQLADRFCLHDLKARAMEYVLDRFDEVSAQPSFYHLPCHLLTVILTSDTLANCDEEQVLDVVMSWAAATSDPEASTSSSNVLPDLLACVRWPLLHLTTESRDFSMSTCTARLAAVVGGEAEAHKLLSTCLERTHGQPSQTRRRRRKCRMRRLLALHSHEGAVSALAFVGDKLVSGSWDQTVRVWSLDRKTGRANCDHVLRGHYGAVLAIAHYHPKGGRGFLLTGGADSTVLQWDADTFELRDQFVRPSGAVLSLEVCPALGLFVVGCRDGCMWLVSIQEEKMEVKEKLKGHRGGVYDIKVMKVKNEDMLISCANDACLRLWRLSSTEATVCCFTVRAAHTQAIYSLAVVGTLVLSASYDRTVKVWQAFDHDASPDPPDAPHLIALREKWAYEVHRDAASSLAVCAEDLVCSGGWDGRVYSFNPVVHPSGAAPVKIEEERQGRILAMAANKDGDVLAVGGNDNHIILYV